MRPSKDAGRPSCLAMNPHNREASIARRVKLLAAFNSLDEDTRADLLELFETMTFTAAGVPLERRAARDIIQRIYAEAGWDS